MRYPVDPDQLLEAQEWNTVTRLDGEDPNRVDLAQAIDQNIEAQKDHRWRKTYGGEDDPDWSDNPCTLGLYWCHGEIKPSHFIGAVHLPFGEVSYPLFVRPREPLQEVDYAAMFAAVLAAPVSVTGMELPRLFGCDPDAAAIEAHRLPQLTLLEVIAFLATAARFVQRHLRQGFVSRTENLTGRVKGQVLLAAQIRTNLVRARADRVVCRYQEFNLNTLENRLLKAALEVCARWLSSPANGHAALPEVQHWVWTIRSALASVPDYRPQRGDWSLVRETGLMAAYASPLALARLVLTRLHLRASGKSAESGRTLPFFLDANRLFEGWVGVCLSRLPGNPSVRGQMTFTLPGPPFRNKDYEFRPDFVVDERIVVDSKYKITPEGNPRVDQSDLYQVVGYARFCAKPPGEPGLQEACIAVPGDPMPHWQEMLDAFAASWNHRYQTGHQWHDGFRLTMIRVPVLLAVLGHP
jgi:5-methylcytosine-specific restriction enzyme subunit McrC